MCLISLNPAEVLRLRKARPGQERRVVRWPQCKAEDEVALNTRAPVKKKLLYHYFWCWLTCSAKRPPAALARRCGASDARMPKATLSAVGHADMITATTAENVLYPIFIRYSRHLNEATRSARSEAIITQTARDADNITSLLQPTYVRHGLMPGSHELNRGARCALQVSIWEPRLGIKAK